MAEETNEVTTTIAPASQPSAPQTPTPRVTVTVSEAWRSTAFKLSGVNRRTFPPKRD